ncbi:alpha/beta hydrolase [Thalassotalea atypica]|uniref:alpha/beta hydrolase n=1 Tax=Thalassotalea atypica TaxID=2054316 RepID=UPI002572AFAC|nr:alpha/beta hydrolase [Thalassotalea atypica]
MIEHISRIIHYGSDKQQYGRLIKANFEKKIPVVVVIHGGYWKDNHDLDTYPTTAIVEYLKSFDVAIWNLEYRRMEAIGENTKAPWPALHMDIADGIDFLTDISIEENLDLSRILIIGHSAGGHLATWAGCRDKIPCTSVLFKTSALKIKCVLSIAGILNLSNSEDVDQPEQVCRLMGGGYEQFPERYKACDPNLLDVSGVNLSIVHGNKDKCVEISQALSYCENASSDVEKTFLSQADHFSMLPHEGVWHQEYWLQLKNIINKKIVALG